MSRLLLAHDDSEGQASEIIDNKLHEVSPFYVKPEVYHLMICKYELRKDKKNQIKK